MKKVGEIREIWRYPVKGMAGERLQAGSLGAQGLAGDRIWAVRDNARQEIQSCKFRPELLLCSARVEGGEVEIRFPDGTTGAGSDAASHARVSRLIGHASTLEALRPPDDLAFYRRHRKDDHTWLDELKATFEREPGEPLPGVFDDLPPGIDEYVGIPGTFFLVTPFHLLTTSTLAWLKGIHPTSDWDARRFRPNIVIDTGDAGGLVEQDWIGRKITLGEATLDTPMSTPRCGAITRAQAELPADSSMLRTVVKRADQNVGIYGVTATAGGFRVGDAVYVSDPA